MINLAVIIFEASTFPTNMPNKVVYQNFIIITNKKIINVENFTLLC